MYDIDNPKHVRFAIAHSYYDVFSLAGNIAERKVADGSDLAIDSDATGDPI